MCGWKKNNKKSSKVLKTLLLFLSNIFKLNYVLNKQYKRISLLIIPDKHYTSSTQASKKLLNVPIVLHIYIKEQLGGVIDELLYSRNS
jgi:DNA replication protein DnaC